MAVEDIYNDILEYLKKENSANTFRLARQLNIKRDKLLNFIKKLEDQGAVEVRHGLVKFIKFVSEEKPKKPKKPVKKITPKPKKTKTKRKPATRPASGAVQFPQSKALPLLQAENKQLKEKLSELGETIKELEKKASLPPKTIIKTVIKKIPVPSLPSPKKKKKRKRKRKKVKKEIKPEKVKRKSKTRGKRSFPVSQKPKVSVRFKVPQFKFLKKIKQLKKPEFAK